MEWPWQSPYTNPIENIWAALKANVAKHNPNSRKTLIKWIRYERKRLPKNYAVHLMGGMQERVEALIRVKGNNPHVIDPLSITVQK